MTHTEYIWSQQLDTLVVKIEDGERESYANEPSPFGKLVSQDGGAVEYFHFDCIPSTRQLTDAQEAIVQSYSYSAFGGVLSLPRPSPLEFEFVGGLGYEVVPAIDLSYVRARHYSHGTGRWQSLDRAQFIDGPNLYRYVGNDPINDTDPSGLYGLCRQKQVEFANWVRREQVLGTGWLNSLPDCPCTINVMTIYQKRWCGWPWEYTDIVLLAAVWPWYDSSLWNDITEADQTFHPRAALCMRSKRAPNGAGQQCCYSKKGWLITEPLGAGTPDRQSPASVLPHVIADVVAFNHARFLDEHCTTFPQFVDQYIQHRPPNRGKSAFGQACGFIGAPGSQIPHPQ